MPTPQRQTRAGCRRSIRYPCRAWNDPHARVAGGRSGPFPSLERQTRARTGSTACEAAPGLVFGGPKTSHGASVSSTVRTFECGAEPARTPSREATPTGHRGVPGAIDGPVDVACAVRGSRQRRERAQALRVERWVRCLFWPACLPFRGPEKTPNTPPFTAIVLLAFTADAIRARCRTGSGSGTAASKSRVYCALRDGRRWHRDSPAPPTVPGTTPATSSQRCRTTARL